MPGCFFLFFYIQTKGKKKPPLSLSFMQSLPYSGWVNTSSSLNKSSVARSP